MRISQKGIELIKRFEGLRLEAYLDQAGVWTIGYGHTKGVNPNDRITEAQAEAHLRADLNAAEVCLHQYAPKLNQNQFDALASFIFNLGCTNFHTSTLLKKLNRNKFLEVPFELGKWVNVVHKDENGKVIWVEKIEGLVTRRAAEADLFMRPVNAAPAKPKPEITPVDITPSPVRTEREKTSDSTIVRAGSTGLFSMVGSWITKFFDTVPWLDDVLAAIAVISLVYVIFRRRSDIMRAIR